MNSRQDFKAWMHKNREAITEAMRGPTLPPEVIQAAAPLVPALDAMEKASIYLCETADSLRQQLFELGHKIRGWEIPVMITRVNYPVPVAELKGGETGVKPQIDLAELFRSHMMNSPSRAKQKSQECPRSLINFQDPVRSWGPSYAPQAEIGRGGELTCSWTLAPN